MSRAGGPTRDEFGKRVEQSFKVVDAILRGTLLPEPDEQERRVLGLADYDPELRYRVAKDVLEQHYGKARQSVDVDHGDVPFTLVIPSFMPQQLASGQQAALPAGEHEELVYEE